MDKMKIPIVVASVVVALIFASVLAYCIVRKARLRKLQQKNTTKQTTVQKSNDHCRSGSEGGSQKTNSDLMMVSHPTQMCDT